MTGIYILFEVWKDSLRGDNWAEIFKKNGDIGHVKLVEMQLCS